MTKSMDLVLDRVGRLSDERQDEIANLIDRLIELDDVTSRLTSSDWVEIDRRLAAPARYASDADVEAFFRSSDA